MKIRIQSLFLLVLCFSACIEDNTPKFCHVTSVNNLEWLKAEMVSNGYYNKSSFADILVYHAYYQGNEVIYIDICCPTCNVIPPQIKACNGEVVGRLHIDINPSLLLNEKIIWRSQNGVCS
ncbi:MAG TPA: hypothetical protein PLM56_14345 [Cyclobacteriaceae bacterium]|mgnify:FL=1|jgi:hypothetical protein|nr:hypothetical protein [Cytophagales bacterium]HMR56501.1 hypothetical protein [Cyclobacteriaceae bacterium]HRF34683.1 hypothetical protein [Cyclobacteriaceae bacterium]